MTYGVHKFHKFHTLTRHFYISRPIFFHRNAFEAWPQDLQQAMREAVKEAVVFQRQLAVEEDKQSRAAIEKEGCEIVEADHAAFVATVQPLLKDARNTYGEEIFAMLPKA